MKKNIYEILPEYAPLYPSLPYVYKDYEKISIYAKGKKEILKTFLPAEFELTGDIFEVFVLKNNEVEGLDPYSEGGLIIPCQYKNQKGAVMAFEYVDSDDALCAGREIWGYPKKLGKVTFEKNGTSITGKVFRKGKEIINVTLVKENMDVEVPVLFPRLQVKRMPGVENGKMDLNFVVHNEFHQVFTIDEWFGRASLQWEESAQDPLSLLGPTEVLGGKYVRGGFTLDYGKIIDRLPLTKAALSSKGGV
ncbi:acetoacetate decarboxylase family protein [Cytobacillus sp. NCCP-133]|uniref:acetoacetate decarboxylase family protein n=1 Tax=Cytobacillus sp. NCCP-133 TaxID=766848 RepID=UPI0022317B5E|nr:acetoacetate decarboxylase family protein [Cytobacillus sp. NCCP-133]GLB61711.1 acetoacetate decarboxylase [Cytobacillus sp. NCCP-133]